MALTQKDLDSLKQLFELTLEEKKVVTRQDLKYLPTKDEFSQQMADLMKEVKDSREEQTILNNRTSDHEDRLEKLEEIHPQYQHA